ncbi:hypothetical protein LCGC14_1633800 [marine sediment metagenome]|uniref:Uncharacterized protein n=1 Tax=marine sediment metagenome TaxID=412755 RepID=A0A0F9I264_9ZZZZ
MNIFAAVAGLTFTFVIMQIISFNVEGYGGLAATSLTSTIALDAATVPVTTTSGFLTPDYIVIGDEAICYTTLTASSFTNLTRGCRDTEAQSHVAGARVYNETTSVMNEVVGFNIAETMSTSGAIRTITMVPRALLHAVPRLVMWDYSYLEGDLFGAFPLVYIKYLFLYPLSAGFLMAFIILTINVFMGIARVFTG